MFKTTKFWLIISLCVNLLFLGVFVGGAMHKQRAGGFRDAPPNEVSAFMRAMPENARREWIGEVRAFRPQNAEREGRANIDELANLIAAQPFDEAALRGYLDENRQVNDARIAAAQNAMVTTIGDMTAEERAQMAARLREMPKHRGARPPHGKRRGEPRHD